MKNVFSDKGIVNCNIADSSTNLQHLMIFLPYYFILYFEFGKTFDEIAPKKFFNQVHCWKVLLITCSRSCIAPFNPTQKEDLQLIWNIQYSIMNIYLSMDINAQRKTCFTRFSAVNLSLCIIGS